MVKSLFKIKYLFVVLMLLCIVPMVCACDLDSDKSKDEDNKEDSSYTITYVLDGGTNSLNNPNSFTEDSATIVLANPTKEGYAFIGWYSESTFDNQVTKIYPSIKRDITLYAKFIVSQDYTITYNFGSITNVINTNPSSYNVTTETITLANASKNGYVFDGWYSDVNYTTRVTQITKGTTGNIVLYAKFIVSQDYTITYNFGSITDVINTNPSSYNVTTETITLANASKSGYVFDGWYSDVNYTTKVTQITKGTTGDIVLYAKLISTPGLYSNNVLVKNWANLVKDGDITYNNSTKTITDCNTELSGDLKILNNVTSIGNDAFRGCGNLVRVIFDVNSQLATIRGFAFSYCDHLTSIIIPSSVTSINACAFIDCYALAEVYNLSSLNITVGASDNGDVGKYAKVIHTNENDTSNIVKKGNIAYYVNGNDVIALVALNKTLTTYTLRNDCSEINRWTFSHCINLTTIIIPSSVTSIGRNAFYYCAELTSITIPSGVTYIGDYVFCCCPKLSVNVDSCNTVYDSRNNCNAIIKTATNELIVGCKNAIIPSSVTSIGAYAFYGCSELTNITIPSSVTNIGEYAFDECISLASVTIQRIDSIVIDSSTFGETSTSNPGQLKLNGTGATLYSLNGGTRTGINGTYYLNS